MTAELRLLVDADRSRAAAITSFINSYPSTETRRTLESALRSIAELFPESSGDFWTLPWEAAADPTLFDQFAERIQANVGPQTAKKYMWALRGVLRHLARNGLADRASLSTTIDGFRTARASKGGETQGVTTEEFMSMLHACRRDPNVPKGRRDAAVLALLGGAGPRRGEAAGVNLADIDWHSGNIYFRYTKGGEPRRATLHPAVAGHIAEWRRFHTASAGALFPRVAKNGLIEVGPGIGDKAIYRIVTKRRDEAGVDPGVTPHSFRRWFVTTLLEAGVDLFTVMRAVGHALPGTTQRYDKRGDAVVAAAVRDLHVPTVEELCEDD